MRARLALVLGLLAAPACAEAQHLSVVQAKLVQPTDRYDHGVLGDVLEWGGLQITVAATGCGTDCPPQATLTVTLPPSQVFEDITARVVDADGDGLAEVLVVQTDRALGAMLTVYGPKGQRVAQTKPYGQPHRWLAPAGVGDFDSDGSPEIAYIDRPHLARELVFVRLQQGALVEVARLPNLTNHRIGDDFISGGARNCGQGDELVLASGDWSRLMVARIGGVVDLGAYSKAAMRAALACH